MNIYDNNEDSKTEYIPSEETTRSTQHTNDSNEAQLPPPAGKKDLYPTWIDLLTILGVFIASTFLVGALVIALRNFTTLEPELINALTYSLQFALVILFVIFQRRSRGDKESVINFKFRAANFPLLLWGIILTFISGVVIEPLLAILPNDMLEAAFNSLGRGGWTILQLVVLAPLFEELLFRGYIQGSISRKYPPAVAIVVSALFFGIVHVIPQQVINAFVIGIILGYIYYRTRSLSVVIIMHAINNAIAYVMLEIFGTEYLKMDLRQIIANDTIYYFVYGVCVAIFIIGMVGLVATLRKSTMNKSIE